MRIYHINECSELILAPSLYARKLELDFAESQEMYLTDGDKCSRQRTEHEYYELDTTPTINRYPRAFLFFLFERKSSQPTRFFATNSFVVPTRPLPPTHSANCECFLKLIGSDRISSSGCDPLGYPKSINNQPWDNCNFQLFARQTNRAFHRFDLSTDCVCVRGCRDYIKLNCTTKLVKQSSMRSQAD